MARAGRADRGPGRASARRGCWPSSGARGRGGGCACSPRAGELEREFPFGVVRQLFERRRGRRGRARWLAGAAARRARGLRCSRSRRAPPAGDASFAALHGLYWLALNLAAERPLLLEVDDLHWCDRPSLRFLAYLVRRLEGLPVLVGATLRSTDPGTDAALLAEIANDPATAHVRPGPLQRRGGRPRSCARGSAREPDERFCAACHRATGGNPLLAAPAAHRARGRRGHARRRPAPTSCAEIGSRAVSRTVLLRLARLPGEAVERGPRGRRARRERRPARRRRRWPSFDEAQVGGARWRRSPARRSCAPEPPLGFVHPLVRDAVYHELPPGERELLHARAAEVLRDAGAPRRPGGGAPARDAAPRERRGSRRAASRPAQAASRRGAPDSAVTYLRRALEEPPPSERRAQLLLELGLVEALVPRAGGHRAPARGLRPPRRPAPARARRLRPRPHPDVRGRPRRGRRVRAPGGRRAAGGMLRRAPGPRRGRAQLDSLQRARRGRRPAVPGPAR